MTSRERFEAWLNADCNAHFAKFEAAGMAIVPPYRPAPHEIWQAAEAAAVKRCLEIVRKWEYYGTYQSNAIKAEFPEAFK